MTVKDKKNTLERIIRDQESLLVAFSGGVDSTLLAVLARNILGDNSRCVLLDSPVVPRSAVGQAQTIARDHALHLDIVTISLMDHEEFCRNPPDRCYHCRKLSSRYLKREAARCGMSCIADGANLSDTHEHRPGLAASTEEGIIHPFIEAGMTKQDIRDLARECGLSIWQKPSSACLSSRIPYGQEITLDRLGMIENAEELLRARGFSQLRVRLHGPVARIEVPQEDMPGILAIREDLNHHFKKIGFSYVTLDLEGFRSGSMDEVL